MLLAVLTVACSEDEGPLTVSQQARQNAMVIDEGIDVSSSELRGKILATFTVVCPDQVADTDAGAPGADGGTAVTFDERKRAYLADLMTPRESCHLVPGISVKPDPLESVKAYRDRWNGMLRGQRYANTVFSYDEWNLITSALDAEFKTFAYHGTATSGTVAHDNPGVRLVLVERQLARPGALAMSFQCLVQAEVDQSTALLGDPDVRSAYAAVPLSDYSTEFRNVVADFNVGVINESYGRAPRAILESLQASHGCPTPISLAGYFAAVHDLGRAWVEAHPNPVPYVWAQSAGNDSAQIDSAADSYECTPGDARHLLVGSTDLGEARSTFSNRGACVDVYAPGEKVIAPYAGGWLLPVQGTSFAAPLVTRLISRANLSPYDAGQARQRLLDQRDFNQTIPVATFPRDFFYAPSTVGTRLGALTIPASRASSTTSVPAMPATAMPGQQEDLDRIDWSDRALGPLHALLRPRMSR